MHQEAAIHGAIRIDLPVYGSTPTVGTGTVTLFGGGEQEIFDSCIPIFKAIARQWYLSKCSTGKGEQVPQ
jgi:3-hydroxyisobutyrate dehydrogenase-like beta-hydroxyacid dehydrogenase